MEGKQRSHPKSSSPLNWDPSGQSRQAMCSQDWTVWSSGLSAFLSLSWWNLMDSGHWLHKTEIGIEWSTPSGFFLWWFVIWQGQHQHHGHHGHQTAAFEVASFSKLNEMILLRSKRSQLVAEDLDLGCFWRCWRLKQLLNIANTMCQFKVVNTSFC